MVSLYNVMCSIVSDIVYNSPITGSCTAVIHEWSTTPLSEEGAGSLVSLLFSNTVRTGVKVVTRIVFVNQMLLMMAGDVERNPGPGKISYNSICILRYSFTIIHRCGDQEHGNTDKHSQFGSNLLLQQVH